MGGLTMDDLRARAWLSAVAEPGDPELGRAVQEFGAPEVVDRLLTSRSTLARGESRRARLLAVDVDAVFERAAAVDAELLIPGGPGWPTTLDDLADEAPMCLWVRGSVALRPAVARSVAIVGARASTAYGDEVAAVLGADLATEGWTVVSGGAYGIDARGHRGALAAGGITVAVLACGIDVAYPRGNEDLLTRIAADGALVTEAPPGAAPHRHRFLVRNRLIAAMSRGVVVVQAAARSGSLSTARWARALGRPVMGVPGPLWVAASAGVNQAIRTGEAVLISSASDVIDELRIDGADRPGSVQAPALPLG
jgi:DNA processing protein